MNNLRRRDQRRAMSVASKFGGKAWAKACGNRYLSTLIAEALCREREETGFGAMNWFLFSGKNERAKVKRACAKPGSKPNFAAVKR